ncbi:hypothetical protein HBH70_216430 [Parastagonospora nodorum]|nr:hypothetical protein HBH52_216790 [Parastagonospora nodorum]KAH4059079.1 hypothetical protein HBH50_227570 [Parastagonospora nodorum]KAH4078738.1 hypothetical protein HBH48_226420 [Parastagonospora nodorum]KAH4112208.1 hypothetical protein HBH47_229310 [Parastagonospora nodorum]KAH4182265.1 hypothetical protein HBH42_223150 [Parastagonospora nodorum]
MVPLITVVLLGSAVFTCQSRRMDPLTITSTVLRITGSCVGAAHTLWEIRNAWKRAPMTVDTLCSQLKLTAASLSQIQSLLLGDSDVLRNKPDLVDTFDTTLTSCLVLSTSLDKYMLKIKNGALQSSRMTWKVKFKTLWNENEVKELLGHLHTQQGGISVLVNLLQMDSISDIRRLVQQHERLLRNIAANTSILRAHGVDAPGSILGTDEPNDSIFSQLIHSKDDDDHGFETVILNSKVYSTAFTDALHPATDDGQSVDARTVVEPTHGPMILAIDAPQIRSSISNLHVVELYAQSHMPYTARSDSELAFEAQEVMVKIQRVTESRYRGELYTNSRSSRGRPGFFARHLVSMGYTLDPPLQIRTNVACSIRLNDEYLNYEAGETVSIMSIKHSYRWWYQRQEDSEATDERMRGVLVCDVNFDTTSEHDINRLLKYFARPMPGLTSLSRSELHGRMRNIIRTGSAHEISELLAHCGSLADLQYVASEEKKLTEEMMAIEK